MSSDAAASKSSTRIATTRHLVIVAPPRKLSDFEKEIIQPIGMPRHMHMAAFDLGGLSVHPGQLVALRFEAIAWGNPQIDHRATRISDIPEPLSSIIGGSSAPHLTSSDRSVASVRDSSIFPQNIEYEVIDALTRNVMHTE